MEETNATTNEPINNESVNESNEPEVTVESLMAELAELKATNERNKKALDKTLKEKGDLTKQYRDLLSDSQKAKLDKEAADEEHKQYVTSLEEFKHKTEAKDRYIMQGMTPEMASEAAEAEVTGDMDKLAEIQKQHTELLLKEKERELIETRQQPEFGTGEYSSMTKEQIFAIKDREERKKAIAANMNLF